MFSCSSSEGKLFGKEGSFMQGLSSPCLANWMQGLDWWIKLGVLINIKYQLSVKVFQIHQFPCCYICYLWLAPKPSSESPDLEMVPLVVQLAHVRRSSYGLSQASLSLKSRLNPVSQVSLFDTVLRWWSADDPTPLPVYTVSNWHLSQLWVHGGPVLLFK